MRQISMREAKTQLSRLVDEVANGEDIVIARAGKAVARLVRFEPEKPSRQLGLLKGRIRISDNFDAPLPDDLLDLFEGNV